MSKKMESSFLASYYTNLAADKDMAMNYLHQTVTWQVTIFLGGTIAVLSQLSFPSIQSMLVLCLLLACSVHFAFRAAKAYVNLMRWALIERRFLVCKNWTPADEVQLAAVSEAIETYHRRWVSPLPTTTVLYKLFFELGFGIQVFVLLALVIACTVSVDSGYSYPLLTITFVGVFGETYCNFWNSPYYRAVQIDADTSALR